MPIFLHPSTKKLQRASLWRIWMETDSFQSKSLKVSYDSLGCAFFYLNSTSGLIDDQAKLEDVPPSALALKRLFFVSMVGRHFTIKFLSTLQLMPLACAICWLWLHG
jgi:hypothetical protein